MDIYIDRLHIESILDQNFYYTNFNHQKLVTRIGDFLVRTS